MLDKEKVKAKMESFIKHCAEFFKTCSNKQSRQELWAKITDKNNLKKIWQETIQKCTAWWEFISGAARYKGDQPPIAKPAKFGFIVLGSFVLVFCYWAMFSTIETAAIAEGKVIAATNRKTIQHLEGGIIKKIYVQEGSVVKANDPLIKLDDTIAKANYDAIRQQANELQAMAARLAAERDFADTIEYPDTLLMQKADPAVQKILKIQQEIFDNDRKTLKTQTDILQQQVIQLENEIESYHEQITASDDQAKYLEKELEADETLDKKRLIEKTKVWAIQREAARIAGMRADSLGRIAEAQKKIGETKQQMITIKNSMQKDVLSQLNETEAKLLDALERERSEKDIYERTLIVAPQAGTVVGLLEHTVGGVVSPGKPILDIVPSADQLIIEAKINPLDVQVVHPGLKAKVRLIAYRQRTTPMVTGIVTTVSADSFQDQQTGRSYYTARVTIGDKELKRLKKIKLYPGMPVQVMIITNDLSPMTYFLIPIKESFNRAFREQ